MSKEENYCHKQNYLYCTVRKYRSHQQNVNNSSYMITIFVPRTKKYWLMINGSKYNIRNCPASGEIFFQISGWHELENFIPPCVKLSLLVMMLTHKLATKVAKLLAKRLATQIAKWLAKRLVQRIAPITCIVGSFPPPLSTRVPTHNMYTSPGRKYSSGHRNVPMFPIHRPPQCCPVVTPWHWFSPLDSSISQIVVFQY